MRLGSYQHKENKMQEGRDAFYLDAGGSPTASFSYQLESYLGVFKGTAGYKLVERSIKPESDNIVVFSGNAYAVQDCVVYPVLSKKTKTVTTTLGKLRKHQLIGFYNVAARRIVFTGEKELSGIFQKDNRNSSISGERG